MTNEESNPTPTLSTADVYAAPRTQVPASPPDRALRRELIVLGVTTFMVGFFGLLVSMIMAALMNSVWGFALGGAMCVVVLAAAVHSTAQYLNVGREFLGQYTASVVSTGVLSMTAGAFSLVGMLFAFFALLGGGHGRQLRKGRRILLPETAPDDDWATKDLSMKVEPSIQGALAAEWRRGGQLEHASVAAFARLTLDLMALGAPPKLVRDAMSDGQDEIRHAELCFSVARAIDGEAIGPAPFPQALGANRLLSVRSVALAQLAVNALIDGALQEGQAARVLAKLVSRCEDPALREQVRGLAADEGRHAAHGWDVVEWCLTEGGLPVAAALRGALPFLPARTAPPQVELAHTGAWEKYGIPGAALDREEFLRTRDDAVRRIEAMTAHTLKPRLRAA